MEYDNYEESLKAYRDWKNTIDTEKKISWEEGHEKGREEGFEEGQEKKTIEMARNLKVKGIPINIIVECSGLTEEEINALQANSLYPKISKVAIDGVALICHRNNPDSLVTMEQLHDIFTGKTTRWDQLDPKSRMGDIEVVFDNTSSSTVRYVIEKINKGAELKGNIKATQTNEGVIDYVANVPNAIGVIGSNWIGNDNDTTNLSFNDNIQVMLISSDPLAFNGNSYQPFQAYLAMELYPLSREIYMICTSNRNSLPYGFTSFVSSDKGQRIILKSGILPARQPLRVVNVRENL